jgi:hypothetical protein
MKRVIIFLSVLSIMVLGGWYFWSRPMKTISINLPTPLTYPEASSETKLAPEPGVEKKITATTSVVVTPPVQSASVNLAVPFTSQAPTGNWAQPFQDACEETSVLMVNYYYQNKPLPDKKAVETILVSMVDWQWKTWGKHYNLPVVEVADMAKALFNYNSEIITDLTADKIREQLRLDRPVIIPANGHLLANPYFTGTGPDYHMLVVKGFVGDKFITNDPGTRRGADFIYTETNLMYSIADWNKKESLANGPKVGLVLYNN